MIMSFKTFTAFHIVAISWFIGLSLFGFSMFYLMLSLSIAIIIPLSVLCLIFAKKITKNIIKAVPDEIKKEDDVILQGTPFVATILFFYVNLLAPKSSRLVFGITIVLFAGTVYVSRALGKIKSNPELRFLSMTLINTGTAVIYEVFVLFFPELFPEISTLSLPFGVAIISLLSIIFLLPIALTFGYFSKRYEAHEPKWLKKSRAR